jgi:hypothetical protein
MDKRLVRRVERLEVAKGAVDQPHVEVIYLDEHGRPTRSVPTRPDGLPIPVIMLPTLRTPALEDFQIMATPEEIAPTRPALGV